MTIGLWIQLVCLVIQAASVFWITWMHKETTALLQRERARVRYLQRQLEQLEKEEEHE